MMMMLSFVEYGSMKPVSREGGGDLASKLHMSELEREKGPVSHSDDNDDDDDDGG